MHDWCHIKIDVKGNEIIVFKNDRDDDNTHEHGSIGLYSWAEFFLYPGLNTSIKFFSIDNYHMKC